jgi:arsenate reductase (glutaredoxin)
MIKIYGIKNCDTVKKALKFCDSRKIQYDFIDFKKHAPTKQLILNWKKQLGDWPVNPNGRTYKQFAEQFSSSNQEEKIELLTTQTSMLKRPILEVKGELKALGFNEDQWIEGLQ